MEEAQHVLQPGLPRRRLITPPQVKLTNSLMKPMTPTKILSLLNLMVLMSLTNMRKLKI